MSLRRVMTVGCVACVSLVSAAWAQVDDLAPGESPPSAATAESTAAAEPTTTIPAVQAVIETKPTTPAELLRAATIVANLGDPTVAKSMLAKLLTAAQDDKQLADLWEASGTAAFLRFKVHPELNPEATQLFDKVIAAAEQRAADPERLAPLLARLDSDDADDRRAAIELLRTGRGAAVNALLKVLGDETRQAEHARVRQALIALGEDAFGPLVAALDAPQPGLRARVVACLAELPRDEATWYLLAPALAAGSPAEVRREALAAVAKRLGHEPGVNEAAAILHNRAKAYYDDRTLPDPFDEATVEVWNWNAGQGQAVTDRMTARDSGVHIAARLAEDARRLAPQEYDVVMLYLGACLERDAAKPQQDDTSAYDELLRSGPELAEMLLADSLETNHAIAAAAAARALGDHGDVSVVYRGSAPSVLAQAVRAGDSRVRFAAVRSILKLDPSTPFPGSSDVTRALVSFLDTAGEPRALVAGPNQREAQRLAGLLMEAGYACDTIDDLYEVPRALVSTADYELLLVDVRFAALRSGELLAQLRKDARTARTPIGIVYSPYDRAHPTPLDSAGGIVVTPDDQRLAESLARRFAGVQPIVRPQDLAGLTPQLEWLRARENHAPVDQEERLRQAQFALALVRRLCESPHATIYQLSRLEAAVLQLLPLSSFTEDAAAVLAMLGTANGQQALAELASNNSIEMPMRQAAARAFAEGVRLHGILLTTKGIQLQYDRYNASKDDPLEAQQLLAGILDVLESEPSAAP